MLYSRREGIFFITYRELTKIVSIEWLIQQEKSMEEDAKESQIN